MLLEPEVILPPGLGKHDLQRSTAFWPRSPYMMVGSASALTCSIRRSKCFFASFTVVAFIGKPATDSCHVLGKVLQMLVIVLSYDSQHPFATAENCWLRFC